MTRFDEIGRVVEKLARAGETSGYDRRRLVREQRAAEARLAETRAGLERDRAKLSALLGQVSEDGVTGHLLPDVPPTLESLHKKLAERPDLSALAARVKAANADNAAARRNFPEVTFGIGGKRVDDGITRGAGTLFSVSIPLPVFDPQQAGDRRSVAQAMAASAELGLARQGADGELTGLHRWWGVPVETHGHASRPALPTIFPSLETPDGTSQTRPAYFAPTMLSPAPFDTLRNTHYGYCSLVVEPKALMEGVCTCISPWLAPATSAL